MRPFSEASAALACAASCLCSSEAAACPPSIFSLAAASASSAAFFAAAFFASRSDDGAGRIHLRSSTNKTPRHDVDAVCSTACSSVGDAIGYWQLHYTHTIAKTAGVARS